MACQVNKFYISTVLTSIRLVNYVLVMIRVAVLQVVLGGTGEEDSPSPPQFPPSQHKSTLKGRTH